MSAEIILRKEGIEIVKKFTKEEVEAIAKDIAIKLCLAFPEHNLNRSSLCLDFSSIDMYYAKLPKDFSGAKYVIDTNSIYFSEALDFAVLPSVAMHECIHFLQNNNTKDSNFGLLKSFSGLAFNEASVQLMASEANMNAPCQEKYFNININTITPDFYPLECALVNQITYFTGTYPLFHSILYGDDIFKNTFIIKFSKKIYNSLLKKIDKLLFLENELNCFVTELTYSEKSKSTIQLNNIINEKKQALSKEFFNIQNYIIQNCFKYEFNSIRNLDDLHEFKNKLYNYKNIIGYNENYSFYNDFYRDTMKVLELKKAQIKEFGPINLLENLSTELTIVDKSKKTFAFVHTFVQKIKKLFGVKQETIN